MKNPPRVGGDIDAFCTRCKMLLGHTVLAMVGERPARVRCNTCQGEHVYRPAAAAPAARASARAGEREKPVVTTWAALLQGKDLARARKYSTQNRFEKDEVIHHPQFGIGIVQEVRGDKIGVAFKADVKTLVQGKR